MFSGSESLITTQERYVLDELISQQEPLRAITGSANAGDPSELFSITRFVSDEVFATRSGGYGATFRLDGVDTECLSDEAEVAMSTELLGGQRLVPENLVVYQIARKRRGFIPTFRYTESEKPVVAETQRARRDHVAKSGFASVELFFTLYVPPKQAFNHWSPGSHAEASEAQLRQLEGLAQMLRINLRRFGLQRMAKSETEELYSYIFNLHGNHRLPSSLDRIAEEISCERIQWNDDGIKVGSRYGKLFSLLRCSKFTHPNLFGELLRLDTDLVLVLESQRQTTEQTLKAVSTQETLPIISGKRSRRCSRTSAIRTTVLLEAQKRFQPGRGCVGRRPCGNHPGCGSRHRVHANVTDRIASLGP